MNNQEAIEVLKLNNPFMAGNDKETFSKAIDKGIIALDICNSMSKGIPYITVGGKIYKLTDEKGE